MTQYSLTQQNLETIESDFLAYINAKQSFIQEGANHHLPYNDQDMLNHLLEVMKNNSFLFKTFKHIKDVIAEKGISFAQALASEIENENTIEDMHVIIHYAVDAGIKHLESFEQFIFSSNRHIKAERLEQNKEISKGIHVKISERQKILTALRKETMAAYELKKQKA